MIARTLCKPPPIGVKLFEFDVIAADLPEQTVFDLSARAKSTKINIVWTPVEGADGYNIYRSTTPGGPYSSIAEDHMTDYAVYADFGLTRRCNLLLCSQVRYRRCRGRLIRTKLMQPHLHAEQGDRNHSRVPPFMRP